MMRVLHLLTRDSSFQAARGVAILAGEDVEEYRAVALTIGRGGDYKGPIRAAAALRFGDAGFDLIHAWDPPAFIAAVASGAPVIYSPSERVLRGTWSWLATAAYPDVHVVTGSRWACTRQVKDGMSAARCHVILPGIAPVRIPTGRDSDLREALGFAANDFVVLAPGESTRMANHRLALHATAIMGVMDKRYRFLVWGRGQEARAIRDFGARLNQPRVFTEAERRLGRYVEFEELLSVADVAIVTAAAGASLIAIAACAAAGLPIIAVDSPLIREALGDDAVSVVPREGARPLAQRLLELHENPESRLKLGAAAKAASRLKFGAVRFVREYAALYRHVAVLQQNPSSGGEISPAAT